MAKMIKEFKITWRYPNQFGYKNEQYFTCYADSEAMAKQYFREKEGFNYKKIMRIESFPFEHKY
jgi:hypothetical protein